MVIFPPLPGERPQLPGPASGVFAYAGRGNCTAIQVADDSWGHALLFLHTAGIIGEVQSNGGRSRELEIQVTVARKDGAAKFVISPGDVILYLDDEPEQFTVITAAMFGALFRTGE